MEGIFLVSESEKLKYNGNQRREYLNMIDIIGQNWLGVFEGNSEFYQTSYWDLFSRLWRTVGPVRKMDASRFMVNLKSAQTAGKYVETALHHGYLIEKENPKDARSRLIELSPDMRHRLDLFFDQAVDEVINSQKKIISET